MIEQVTGPEGLGQLLAGEVQFYHGLLEGEVEAVLNLDEAEVGEELY